MREQHLVYDDKKTTYRTEVDQMMRRPYYQEFLAHQLRRLVAIERMLEDPPLPSGRQQERLSCDLQLLCCRLSPAAPPEARYRVSVGLAGGNDRSEDGLR